MATLTVQALLDLVLDQGSFTSWDEPVDISRHDRKYRAELIAAAERAGTDESVVTGRGLMRGRPVAVVASEFRFLAGSIGQDAARRIVSAVQRATAEGIPVLATTASGGTRMQEGTPAFVHMIDISRALMAHRAAGLPYLIYLRHPTTGGVFASWGSLGHITLGEPGALIGFLGPKVYELLQGKPFPPNVQTSENLANRGIIDAVAIPDELPMLVDRALSILVDPPTAQTRPPRASTTDRVRTAWESIQITRTAHRPGVREVLRYGSDATVRLQGTEKGERDSAMLVAFARLDGQPCVVIGQDRTKQTPL
ncbi:MAG: carboxyl transferase domain-containing protein, partial [Aeromicrobium sp.]|uniref:carboxyl transferase domain-containing protein n=1 Tax=Aeromicrobium sp. TaxID=1871063 RepID=UPI003C4D4D07